MAESESSSRLKLETRYAQVCATVLTLSSNIKVLDRGRLMGHQELVEFLAERMTDLAVRHVGEDWDVQD